MLRTLLVLSMALALPHVAPALESENAEVAAYKGYRGGGDFQDEVTETELTIDESPTSGFEVSFLQTPGRRIGLWFSRQRTELRPDGPFTGSPLLELDVNYAHIGGTVSYTDAPVRPFLSGGLGITFMDPRRSGLDSETRPSLSVGGGIRLYFTDRAGLRLETRGVYTLMENDSAIFCTNGSCAIAIEGTGLTQIEGGVGVFVEF